MPRPCGPRGGAGARQNKELDPELDKRQIQYTLCYPGFNDVPAKMIARSRERNTLEALQDAVNYLASIREERKAIIAVTEGWLLYREDPDLMRQRGKMEAPLGVDKMRVGPTGKLTLEDTKNSVQRAQSRKSATASAPIWRTSTTTSFCARSSTTRIAATAPST